MFSMAGASLFLPFLPLLPKQILLNNFLSDFPAMTIASDNVSIAELVERPRRWDIQFIRDFMIIFGLVSSVFDYLTFGAAAAGPAGGAGAVPHRLVRRVAAHRAVDRAGRAHAPAVLPQPAGHAVVDGTLVVGLVTLAIPYLPFGGFLGFMPLPAWLMLALLGITALYVVATEMAKRFFYARAAW